jgi:peptidyl-prolyl cis-trans isomerase SurA
MRLRALIALAAIGLVFAGAATAQTPFRPVAVVNDSAITGFDLAQRVLILSLLGYPSDNPEQLQIEALDQLVEDKLKLEAAEQIGIAATPQMITAGIEEYARRAGVPPDEFRASMDARGVTTQALDDMIGAQIVWLNVLRTRYGDQVQPGEDEIDAELALGTPGSTEYRVLEIGLPLAEGGREAETRALAEELSRSLNEGGDFGAAVARYSQAPSAARGGEVGWLPIDRMPPELRQALVQLEPGEVSPPVELPGGLSILKLVDKRQTGGAPGAELRSREAIRDALINQRSDRLSEGLLQEMRRDALIEVR